MHQRMTSQLGVRDPRLDRSLTPIILAPKKSKNRKVSDSKPLGCVRSQPCAQNGLKRLSAIARSSLGRFERVNRRSRLVWRDLVAAKIWRQSDKYSRSYGDVSFSPLWTLRSPENRLSPKNAILANMQIKLREARGSTRKVPQHLTSEDTCRFLLKHIEHHPMLNSAR